MKIYENANDQHVRKVVIYEVSAGLAFDKAGTELLTKEQIVDAFLKGCVVENEGNYKTPTGVNVTDSGAELVFGGGSGGPEVENAIATHGMGWTESEENPGFDIAWDGDTTGLDVLLDAAYKVAEVDSITSASDLIGSTMEVINMVDVESPHIFSSAEITTEDNKVFVCSVGSIALIVVAFEDGTTHDTSFTKGIWFMKATENAYVSRLYKEASTEEVVHKIDQKYIPSGGSGGPEVENAIATHGMGWTESSESAGFDITWDGDTTGLDVVEERYFKVANNISGVASDADLLGSTMVVSPDEGNLEITEDIIETITEDKLITTDNKVYGLMSSLGSPVVFIALEDGTFEGMNFTKGVWFIGVEETLHTSRFYKEAATEEVIHQIDQKYIPSGGSGSGGMVVTVDFDESLNGIADKALDEIIAAFDAGTFVSIKVLMVGAFYMQAPLVIDAYGEPGARDIEATLELGEITLQCKSGTTWTAV